MKLTKMAMLAIAAASLATVSASAQNVSTSGTDLILGFEITDGAGQGSTTDLEVDLGPTSSFTTGATLAFNQLAVADLVATYGSNWATRGDLAWGAAGDVSLTGHTFDVTYSGAAPQNVSTSTGPYNQVGLLVGGLANSTQTANSASASTLSNTSATSWTGARVGGGSGNDFNDTAFTVNGITDYNFSAGLSPLGALSLYSFTDTPGRGLKPAPLLGTFTLTSTGLSYVGINAVSTPEPSAYALGICAVLLFLVLRRRQTVA